MKKTLLYTAVLALALSCGGVKKTQEAVNTGNYIQAIDRSIENLAENKSRKNHQPYVILLEEAFDKYTDRTLSEIGFLKQDGNPANYEVIYSSYTELHRIQERIRPLLPLRIIDEDRNARFKFQDYDGEILAAKVKLSEYLYGNATELLANGTQKHDFRQAYKDLQYLDRINPGYADTKEKIEEAYARGVDYVKVDVINDTDQIVPDRLEAELLNFNTYGLNDLWTQYHANPLDQVDYDYAMQVAFQDIRISPEQIREKQVIREKSIPDGYEFLLDGEGNVVRDSLGNKIEVERFRKVTCEFYEFTQFKSAMVTGKVSYFDLRNQQQLDSYPLSSEFVFEHIYADYYGDKRALDNDHIQLLQIAEVPFPSNEQMVYDAGEDLKHRLKSILSRHRFK